MGFGVWERNAQGGWEEGRRKDGTIHVADVLLPFLPDTLRHPLSYLSLPGRYSSLWNPHASELVSYLQEISTGLRVQYNTSVLSTKYSEDSKLHTVFTEQGAVFLAKYLIIATGMRMRVAPPYRPTRFLRSAWY